MRSDIEGPLRDFGRTLADAWARVDHDEDQFAALARGTLSDARLAERLDVAQVLAHALAPHASPRGPHGAPGVLTLYSSVHFDVFAHVWHDAFAYAHDHEWCGAFMLVEGHALHVQHRFERSERICDSLLLGELALDHATRMVAGDAIEIAAGPGFIHGVSHLDAHGLTVSVRSRSTRGRGLTYFRPGLGLALDERDTELDQRMQALRLAAEFGPERLAACLEQLASCCDRRTATFMLRELTQRGWALPERAEEQLHARFGAHAQRLFAACEDVARIDHVTELRARFQTPSARALLAALFVGERREQVLELHALARGDQHEHGDSHDAWTAIGHALVELLVVPSPGVAVPDVFVPAFAAIARGVPLSGLLELVQPAALPEATLEFLASAHAAVHDASLYRPLFS